MSDFRRNKICQRIVCAKNWQFSALLQLGVQLHRYNHFSDCGGSQKMVFRLNNNNFVQFTFRVIYKRILNAAAPPPFNWLSIVVLQCWPELRITTSCQSHVVFKRHTVLFDCYLSFVFDTKRGNQREINGGWRCRSLIDREGVSGWWPK